MGVRLRTSLLAALFVLALAAPAGASVPQYLGAQTHPFWNDSSPAIAAQELDKLAESGSNVVRVDISWSSLELGGKGQFASGYTARVDQFMNDAAARGIKVIPALFTTPCWASSAPETLKLACSGSWWDRGVQYYAPANAADYADAAAWVAQRWGSKMAALEVWNEPNLDGLTAVDKAAAYAPILKAAYPKVKAVAPGLPVLGPGMAFSDGDFLNALYALGVKGSFDGLSMHPYNEWRAPGDLWQLEWRKYTFITGVEWIHDILVANGDGAKKLWFTEFGWPSCKPNGTSSWCVTEAQQAQYTADAMRIIRDRWDFVEAAAVYNLRAKGTSLTDREQSYGMLYRDFTPKPVFGAFKSVIAELRGSTPPPPPPPPAPAPLAVSLIAPAAASTFDSNLCFSAGATSAVKVEFLVDGKVIGSDSTSPYSFSYSAPKSLKYAAHTVAARAYDASGKTLTTASRSVTRKRGAAVC